MPEAMRTTSSAIQPQYMVSPRRTTCALPDTNREKRQIVLTVTSLSPEP